MMLTVIEDFITPEEEALMMTLCDKHGMAVGGERRCREVWYGAFASPDPSFNTGWHDGLLPILDRYEEQTGHRPNACMIRRTWPGEYLPPHIDGKAHLIDFWSDIELGADAVFRHGPIAVDFKRRTMVYQLPPDIATVNHSVDVLYDVVRYGAIFSWTQRDGDRRAQFDAPKGRFAQWT